MDWDYRQLKTQVHPRSFFPPPVVPVAGFRLWGTGTGGGRWFSFLVPAPLALVVRLFLFFCVLVALLF